MPITHRIALIAPVDGLTPFSLVASDADKKLDSVTLGAGLDYGSGGILSLIPSEIDHNSLLNVHQDVNTDASPLFAGLTIGSLAGIIKGAAGVLSAVIDGISGQVLMTDGSNNYSWTSACFNLDGGSATTSFIGVGGSPIDGGSA